jgi:adenylate kinase
MDKGALVPDSVIIDLIRERLQDDDAKNGVMFDGFPRTVPQAEALSEIVDVSAVLAIDVPDERIVERICGRYSCGNCGAVYHDTFNPIEDGICACGSFSEKRRADDVEETVLARLEAYHTQTSPLADFYRDAGIFHQVDGDRDIDVITSELLAVLG